MYCNGDWDQFWWLCIFIEGFLQYVPGIACFGEVALRYVCCSLEGHADHARCWEYVRHVTDVTHCVQKLCVSYIYSKNKILLLLVLLLLLLLLLLLTYLLTPWSRILLEKLTGSAASQKFPAFLEPEGSSPYSQVPATCPYPEPTPSSPHNLLPLPEDPS